MSRQVVAQARVMLGVSPVRALQNTPRMCDSAMLEFLEQETRGHHAASDADRLSLISPYVERTDYLAYLAKLYTFEAPIEYALVRTPGLEQQIPLKPRLGQILLAQDLLALGLRLPKLDKLPRAVTPFGSVGEALGWLYVVERGRRLHGTLRRHLSMKLPHEMRAAGAYFRMHEGRAFANWQELGHVLDRYAKGTLIAQQVLLGAQDAFRAQHGAFVGDTAQAA